jgi:hypothetical protein
MTGQRLDPEQIIREWLAESAPDRAPGSLRDAVEAVTSQPAGRGRPWPRTEWRSLRFAGRVAAAIAILGIAASGVYFYGNFRATSPAAPSASASAAPPTASATGTIGASPSTSSALLQPTVTQLPGSNWKLVRGAFPQMVRPIWTQYEKSVFALTSGGFVAFVPSAGTDANPQPNAATSWETRVYQSPDGIDWTKRASLPNDAAAVTAVAESGGTIVAVGSTGTMPNESAAAWTTTDLQTWHATDLPTPAQTDTYSTVHAVASGPAGFLACGTAGASDEFWTSADGLFWTPLVPSGVPEFAWDDGLYAVSDGWAISGYLSDRAATWHSVDGARWSQAWTGPAPSGLEYYALGPVLDTPGGGYLSFGVAGMGPGGQPEKPYDQLIWTSRDGLSWAISARVPSPGWIADYRNGPGGYVAAGVLAPGDQMVLPMGSPAVWTSKDGRVWKAVAGLESMGSMEVLSVVGDGAHVVVVCVDQAGNLQLVVGDGK